MRSLRRADSASRFACFGRYPRCPVFRLSSRDTVDVDRPIDLAIFNDL